jgi:hypothetical protein
MLTAEENPQKINLTLTAADLSGRYYLECFETTHTKRYDFDEVKLANSGRISYRCEHAGV